MSSGRRPCAECGAQWPNHRPDCWSGKTQKAPKREPGGGLFDKAPAARPPDGDRDGRTYDAAADRAPLNRQAQLVWDLMVDGEWRSLAEISAATGEPEASISARLRDLRKERFGGHSVPRRFRRAADGSPSRTREYRLEPRG